MPPHMGSIKPKQGEIAMKRYMIERDIPGVGSLTGQQLEQTHALVVTRKV